MGNFLGQLSKLRSLAGSDKRCERGGDRAAVPRGGLPGAGRRLRLRATRDRVRLPLGQWR